MTDRPDFETMLERRLQAYAATGARPILTSAIARSTISAAAMPVARPSLVTGPRRPLLVVGLAALLVLVAVAGAAFVGRLPQPIRGVFTEGPNLDSGSAINAIALPDGRVLVGVRPDEETVPGTSTLRCSLPCKAHVTVLDPRTGMFSPASTLDPPTSLAVESMALLGDGRVLILNALDEGTEDMPTMIYDPVADRFEEADDPVEGRGWPFLVPLQDGRVLIGGGAGGIGRATAELFDPATRTFAPAGSMTRSRGFGASAVLLGDGRVLVTGGGADLGTSAELFDPTTDTFTPTGPMTVARGALSSATRLEDGRVLLAGGLVPDATDSDAAPMATATAEIFDPVTGTFSAVGSMATPRYGHAASMLDDGTVLLAGGGTELRADGSPVATTDAEIFDPATGTFRTTGSLHQARLMPKAIATDDRTLVIGHVDLDGTGGDIGATTEWFE